MGLTPPPPGPANEDGKVSGDLKMEKKKKKKERLKPLQH
jgi:hypothetical protein